MYLDVYCTDHYYYLTKNHHLHMYIHVNCFDDSIFKTLIVLFVVTSLPVLFEQYYNIEMFFVKNKFVLGITQSLHLYWYGKRQL